MSNNIFLFVVLITGLCTAVACRKDIPDRGVLVCGTADPLNDLEWLHDEHAKIQIDDPGLNAIVVFSFDGMTIIEVQNSLYSSLSSSQFKCDGTLIDFVSSPARREYFDEYWKNRKEITVLYGTRFWR